MTTSHAESGALVSGTPAGAFVVQRAAQAPFTRGSELVFWLLGFSAAIPALRIGVIHNEFVMLGGGPVRLPTDSDLWPLLSAHLLEAESWLLTTVNGFLRDIGQPALTRDDLWRRIGSARPISGSLGRVQ